MTQQEQMIAALLAQLQAQQGSVVPTITSSRRPRGGTPMMSSPRRPPPEIPGVTAGGSTDWTGLAMAGTGMLPTEDITKAAGAAAGAVKGAAGKGLAAARNAAGKAKLPKLGGGPRGAKAPGMKGWQKLGVGIGGAWLLMELAKMFMGTASERAEFELAQKQIQNQALADAMLVRSDTSERVAQRGALREAAMRAQADRQLERGRMADEQKLAALMAMYGQSIGGPLSALQEPQQMRVQQTMMDQLGAQADAARLMQDMPGEGFFGSMGLL